MAMETVQSVRQAEQLASQKEKDAIVSAEQIVSQAETESKELLITIRKSVQEQSESDKRNAKVQADNMLKASLDEAEKEIEELRLKVKEKENEAISLVLSELI